jgi:hypothetical protein
VPGRATQKGTTVNPVVIDLRRELEKARHALIDAQSHLASHAEMNAALHCATTVLYSPLHARVTSTIQGIEGALLRTDQPNTPTLDSRSPEGPWATLAADLDRCMHGRHQDDDCGSCGGTSRGNPYFKTGTIIGYSRHGHPITVPDRSRKHDPAAWCRPAAPEGASQ